MSRRPDISMPRDEAERFLAAQDHLVLVANAAHGAGPLATPARSRFEDGTVRVTLPADDPVVAALATDARACCVAEQFPSYYAIKAVVVHGTATRVEADRPGEAAFAVALERLTTFDFGRLPGAPPPESVCSADTTPEEP